MKLYRNEPEGPCSGCGMDSQACSDLDDDPGGRYCCDGCVHVYWHPVETRTEYRLVATNPDGRLKRWCFAKEKVAAKHLQDLIRDIEERPQCGYSDPYLETRQVSEWERSDDDDT